MSTALALSLRIPLAIGALAIAALPALPVRKAPVAEHDAFDLGGASRISW